jgi:hypothetical protein
LGHPFNVVEKKAFSTRVSQVFDNGSVGLRNEVRNFGVRDEQFLGKPFPPLPELVKCGGHRDSLAGVG